VTVRPYADHWLPEGGENVGEVDAVPLDIDPPFVFVPGEASEDWNEDSIAIVV